MKCKIHSLYRINGYNEGIPYRLFDLASWKNGLAFKDINFSIAGVPIIKIAELNNGIGSTTAYTNQIFPNDVHLLKNDLIFSWSGNPQTSIDIFRFKLEEGWLNQHIFKVIPNENIVNKDFFYFFMKYLKPYFVKIASNKQTTGLGHITIADLKHMNIILPDMKIQHIIATILSSLDNEIELNRQINANLEQQAQAIFKSWFIDFEPFGGTMPDDWQKACLLDIADYTNGLAMQKYRPTSHEQGIFVMKIKELRQGFCDSSSELCSNTVNPFYLIHNGDVIFSWSGSLLVDFWCGGLCGLNQHLFKVTSNKYAKWFYYCWTKFHLHHFITEAADKATTMGHIKRENLAKAEVVIPTKQVYLTVGDLLGQIYNLMIANRIEINTLSALRDTLLPKLMSGEIDVSKIEID